MGKGFKKAWSIKTSSTLFYFFKTLEVDKEKNTAANIRVNSYFLIRKREDFDCDLVFH